MNKSDIIEYLKSNPKDLSEVCKVLDLVQYPYPADKNSQTNEFRKLMFETPLISYDEELSDVIGIDIFNMQHERYPYNFNNIYNDFPFAFTTESIYKEFDKGNNHCKIKYINTYALDENGGIAIIERQLFQTSVTDDITKDTYMQVVTLGEDDGNHFINGSFIYEHYCGTDKRLMRLLNIAMEERTNYLKNYD